MRVLGWTSVACVTSSLAIIIWTSLVRGSWMAPRLVFPSAGPPWELTSHVSPHLVVVLLWAAATLAGAGVLAGLIAVRRGAPVPVRTLLVVAGLAVAVLTVLPPAGSTDMLDYATYGHIAALGHDPYRMTPLQFRRLHPALGISVPTEWQHVPSVYGPLATFEQLVAARLAGASMARTVFWLKLVNTAAFGAVSLTADRLLRGYRAGRVRAHLLWTANPLMIWSLIASGHLDVLGAATGLAGLLVLASWTSAGPSLAALVAGALIGVAADIKATYLLLGLGVAWALRRAPRQALLAGLGAALVLVPSYLLAGATALRATVTGADNVSIARQDHRGIYVSLLGQLGLHHVTARTSLIVPTVLILALAVLALWRLPENPQGGPAVRAALAFALPWLLLWPNLRYWYLTMAICLLVMFPAVASLDWLVIPWLTLSVVLGMPGNPLLRLGHALYLVHKDTLHYLGLLPLIGVGAGFIALCVTRRWRAVPAGAAAGHKLPASWLS